MLAKCLPDKHEDLRSIPQHTCRKKTKAHGCILSAGEMTPWGLLAS